MEQKQSSNMLKDLLKNPRDLMNVARNPGKYAMDFYKSLSVQQKQYVAFAAGAGLILYGVYLNRQKRNR